MKNKPYSWLRRCLILSAIAVVLGGTAGGFWWWKQQSALHYVTVKVNVGDIQRSVGMTGSLNPIVTAQVGSYVSGNIKAWFCDYNAIVKKGQRCALIDPLPFQVIVSQVEANVHTAVAQRLKDRAALANAKVTYERDLKLFDQGIVPQQQIDNDKGAYDQATAQVELDSAAIAAQKAALQTAKINLEYTNIVSPVDGTVITRYIEIGQTVVSSLQSSTLFLIGKDMTKMQVDSNVSEADVGDVKVGAKAYFTVQAYPNRTFWGAVRQIRQGPITVQNVVTYDIVLDVDNKDLALYPGMTADAHIITAENKGVLRVPLPALRFVPDGITRNAHGGEKASEHTGDSPEHSTDRGGHNRETAHAHLWLLVNGELQSVRVQTGLDDGTLVEVSGSELKEGDEVVINAVRTDTAHGGANADSSRQPGNNSAFRQGGGGGAGPRL
jgi:HlyD family secretion protein